MRKHVSNTRPTYLAAVLQDVSKSYVAFLLWCKMRAQRPQAYAPLLHVYVYVYDMIPNSKGNAVNGGAIHGGDKILRFLTGNGTR